MGKSILLIEDDSFFLNFYKTKLTENGFRVDTSVNGIEGLAKLKRGTYDLVLLDLIMPEMDGFHVLSQKALDEHIRAVPVIVFSTLAQESDITEAKKLGAHEYMNKTFYNFDELLSKIKALIS